MNIRKGIVLHLHVNLFSLIFCSGRKIYQDKLRYSKSRRKPAITTSTTEENISDKDEHCIFSDKVESAVPVSNTSTDFALLANAPISVGAYFQFKDESKSLRERFNEDWFAALDIRLLESSIATIPLHKRCNVDMEFLQEHHIQKFENKAYENEIAYDKYLNSTKTDVTNKNHCYVVKKEHNKSLSAEKTKPNDTQDKLKVQSMYVEIK